MTTFDKLKSKLAEDPSSFIVILGAGGSIPAGIPSWNGLKDKLCEALPDIYQEHEEYERTLQYINSSPNLWIAFSRLRNKLGQNRYEQEIIQALSPTSTMPPLYKQLWQLNITGIIDFNLDNFALDAYSEVFKKHVDFATGCEPHKFKNYPMADSRFVFHPHGIISDTNSWVFTDNERRHLYSDSEFKSIMSALVNSKNLLIIGFNVSESSFTQLLADCCIEQKLNGAHNYYFCPNATADIQIELGELGISAISYTPSSVEHIEINRYLEDILKYDSKDILPATIYQGPKYSEADIPSENSCYQISTSKLRDILNGVVANIIPHDIVPNDVQMAELEHFYSTYVTQLHRAWLVDPRSESTNKIYGYTISRVIGSGAFGTVYEAEDDDKNRFALKVLLPEVKDNMSYLSCFRRGIRSMRILTEKNIDGMVRIHESYEVPACVVMDFIDGLTLRDAVKHKLLSSLSIKLKILIQISKIIHNAHQLEEKILHRDLKPENIILQNCYSAQDFDPFLYDANVKILDFDLSWHRGATEKTVNFGAISQGFMAPEQTDTSEDRSLSRNTAVDIYSLGMLAFYVLTGRNPMSNESQFAVFPSRLRDKLKEEYSDSWKCLPQYLSNTIIMATDPVQFNRIPLDGLINNLSTAHEMYLNNRLPNTHPLILHEIMEHLAPYANPVISDFGRHVRLEFPALSKRITFYTKSKKSQIVLNVVIERYANAADPRNRVAKYFKSFGERAIACVNQAYFSSSRSECTHENVTIYLSSYLPDPITFQYIKGLANNILEIRSQLDS